MALPTAGSFDEVMVTQAMGGERRLTRAEFEALPMRERVSAILQKRLRFFREGKEIPIREAMKHY
jgi:hypothetical protein